MLARLTEEIGEVARELNHIYGTKKKKSSEDTKSLGQELSDVIFTVCCMANSHNIDLQQEWERMMEEKQYGRDNQDMKEKENSFSNFIIDLHANFGVTFLKNILNL